MASQIDLNLSLREQVQNLEEEVSLLKNKVESQSNEINCL